MSVRRHVQPLRSYALGQLFVRAQPAEVRSVRVDRAGDAVHDAQRAQDAQELLDADVPGSVLEPEHGVARNARAVSDLNLRQAAELAPRRRVFGDLAHRAQDGDRDGGYWFVRLHNTDILCLMVGLMQLCAARTSRSFLDKTEVLTDDQRLAAKRNVGSMCSQKRSCAARHSATPL